MEAGGRSAAATSGAGELLLQRILRRMNESGGFPALDHSVARIVEALELGEEDTTPLVNAVLADVSLTQKVLRLANSAMYAPMGRNVSTVSHALMVLGFEAVGHLALGVKLIGAMGELSPASPSAEHELARSLLAGSVAGTIAGRSGAVNGEMGVVCSLLHRIGRLLAAFYLPEEWREIQAAVATGVDEDDAARTVLGMALDELGMEMARQWRLPGRIVRTMDTRASAPTEEGDEWLRALTRFSDRSAQLLAGGTDETGLETLAAEFGPALGLPDEELVGAIRTAIDEASSQPLLAGILVEPPPSPAPVTATVGPACGKDPLSLLRAGIHDLGQAIQEHGSVLEIEQVALEIAFRSLDLGGAAILTRRADAQAYRVQSSLSARDTDRLAGFSMPDTGSDLAHLALQRRLDIYIDNPRDTKISMRLPDWVRRQGMHPFFLLPLADAEAKPLGLFYGQQRDDRKMDKEELAQLARLRDLLQDYLRVEPGAPAA